MLQNFFFFFLKPISTFMGYLIPNSSLESNNVDSNLLGAEVIGHHTFPKSTVQK